jgi:hypothetical protein
MKKLIEYTKILRSKNAGPLYITFDLIFNTREDMKYVEKNLTKEAIAKAYEVNNSPLLIQAIINGDDVRVIEFSARLGGGAKYKTIQNVTGFNVLRANLDSMLGEVPEVKIHNTGKCYSRCHIYLTGGKFVAIEGLEELVNNGTIKEYVLTRPFGVNVNSPVSSSDRVASVFIEANNQIDLDNKVKMAISTLKVLDENGNDILKRDMYL